MQRTAIFLGLTAILTLPYMAFGQIVSCSGPDCDWAALLQLAQNILNFIITVSVVVAAAMFAYAGFKYFTARGNTGAISQAHSIFGYVVVGIVITLVAWLVVNVLLDTLTGRGLDERTGEIGYIETSLTHKA